MSGKKSSSVPSSGHIDFVCTIGRMNPPTPGHAKLISKVLDEGLRHGLTDVHIILSETVDFDNPLNFATKHHIIERFAVPSIKSTMRRAGKDVDHIRVHIVPMGKSPLTGIQQMRSESRRSGDVSIVIGEDRKDDFNWVQTYLPEAVVGVSSIPRAKSGGMSGTLVRNLCRECASITEMDPNFHRLAEIYNEFDMSTAQLEGIIRMVQSSIKPEAKKGSKRKTAKNSTKDSAKNSTKGGNKTRKIHRPMP